MVDPEAHQLYRESLWSGYHHAIQAKYSTTYPSIRYISDP